MPRVFFLAFVFVCVLLASSLVSAFPGERFKLPALPLYGEFFSNNYAGSLNLTEDGSLTSYFWFIEAEVKDPTKAPLIRWLQGGPGCSSLLGLHTEIGPYLLRLGGVFEPNDWRWTKFANILVMDSPAGVGFSIDQAHQTWDNEKTAQYNLKAQQLFLEQFPQFKDAPFFVTGESFSGNFNPTLVEAILNSGDKQLISTVKGMATGNPCTGTIGCQFPDPTLLPYLQGQGFAAWSENVSTDPNANYNPYDLLVPTCDNDKTYTMTRRFEKNHPVLAAYGRRRRASFGNSVPPYGPCSMDALTTWLNRADVKRMINAPSNVIYSPCCDSCKYTIGDASMVPIYQRLAKTTSMSLMIYSGTSDSVVNMAQTQTIVHSMGFPLLKKEFQAWNYPYVQNTSQTQLGGFWLEYERFSWAGVRGAGHECPMFQPASSYEMMYSFITTGKPGRM